MSDFVLDNSVGFLVNRTALRLKRELQQAFRRQGFTVTAEQWALLNRLWEQEGLSQVQLAERTFKDKPNVTRMVEVLERNGLVHRQQNRRDRRAYHVFLTPAGRELRSAMIPLAVEVLRRALRGLDENEVEELRRVLERIDRNIDGESRSNGGNRD
jgi:DNA-binding MarR family transcriptional regulator